MILMVNPTTGAITNFATLSGPTQDMAAVQGFVLDTTPNFYFIASNKGVLGSGTTEVFVKAHTNTSIDY